MEIVCAGQPKISVIVPCYNVEAYIDRALESLRAQSFTDFEIIAVDDGSFDGTADRLQRWLGAEPRLRIVKQAHEGLYCARLKGLAYARGEWIAFMDADDQLAPDHLAGLLAGTEDDVDVVVTGFVHLRVDGSTRMYSVLDGYLSGTEVAKKMLDKLGCFDTCCNKLYRHSALQAIDLVGPKVIFHEDAVFNIRVFHRIQGRVRCVNGHTYIYVQRQGSTSSFFDEASERLINDTFELWREFDQVALMLEYSSGLYKRRKMSKVFDITGVVFRSCKQPLMQQLQNAIHSMRIPPALLWTDAFLVARWVKWRLRMASGVRGYFPRWLY